MLYGDDAYGASEVMLCPKKGADVFNYLQSSQRIHIERAFGILMSRWGILWRPLRCSLRRAQRIIAGCMLLHNICMRSRPRKHAVGLRSAFAA